MNNKYPLIGVIGVHYIGSRVASTHAGKDQFARLYMEGMATHGITYQRRAFGDDVKERLAKMLGVTVQYIEDNKPNFRLLMQGYATEYVRKLVDEDFWVKQLAAYIEHNTNTLMGVTSFVVPDVRFQNEADYILSNGGYIIRIDRISPPDYDIGAEVTQHPGESNALKLPYNWLISHKTGRQMIDLKQGVAGLVRHLYECKGKLS